MPRELDDISLVLERPLRHASVASFALYLPMAAVLVGCAQPVVAPVRAAAPAAVVMVPVCDATPSPVLVCEPPPKIEPDPTDVATRRLLAYNDQIRQMQNPELARELARIGDVNGNPQAAVQAAMVMAQTRNTADTGRAVAMLEPVVRSASPDAAPFQPLARLLLARYVEQRRVDEQIERQGSQLRENQRNLQQLNEKLEALKAIERSLNKRPVAASAPPAAAPAKVQGKP